ncbi:unnamed protein product [Rotaria sordida]|uniref:LamG-like jellyroll fold domain-containing protein n=1 Tax=Rotaria sordida TaxID=392033 RepID=A0A813WXR8_9BILA|nr:unnamed protein product [Rotaria sordida]CAF3591632.1 unnamed protein product [Rotaria sordida]
MTEVKRLLLKKQPLLSLVPRSTVVGPQQVKPFFDKESIPSTLNSKKTISEPRQFVLFQQKSLESPPTIATTVLSSIDSNDTKKTNRTSTPALDKPSSPKFNEIKSQKIKQQLRDDSNGCLNAVLVTIIPPVYVYVISRTNSQSSFTNITQSVCSNTTCIGQETSYRSSMVPVLYPFDGNSNDLTGYATGLPLGSSTPGYTTNSYVGSQALSLSSSSQYILIPNVDLAQRSFTIQVWLYPTSSPILGDYGIFGQCDSNSKCLSISLRNARFTLSFNSMNTNSTLIGSRIISNQDWTHLTVVYDAVLYQQQIYVNGLIDAVSNGIVAPYQGTSSGLITTIGKSSSSAYGTSYFQGRIDHFIISAGVVRSACQIYNDATLTAYYPFNTVDTFNDYSVNLFNGIVSGATTISQGYFGQALYFPSNTSYFQAECFPSIETSNPPITFALWVNPATLTGGGSLVHVSNLQTGNGSSCYDLLAFTSTGDLVVQWMQNSATVHSIKGPILPANKWTHVTVVFETSNGMHLYINGQLNVVSTNTSNLTTYTITDPQYITLGPSIPLTCRNGPVPIVSGAFTDAIDEFRIYNRDLNNQEICVLANL